MSFFKSAGPGKNLYQVFTETVPFGRIQLQGAVQVQELESVQNHAGRIGKGIGLDDAHSPGGEGSGHGSEQERPIGGNHGQFEVGAASHQIHRHGLLHQPARQLKVPGNVRGRLRGQITLRKAFQKEAQVLRRLAGLSMTASRPSISWLGR